MIEALIEAAAMIGLVAFALTVGILIGKAVVYWLRKRRVDEFVCESRAQRIEETAKATLHAARSVRIESEKLNKDLRGAANVL